VGAVSTIIEALRVSGISMAVIFAVMIALWAIIAILHSLFPFREEEYED
jgi:hypothetical protein